MKELTDWLRGKIDLICSKYISHFIPFQRMLDLSIIILVVLLFVTFETIDGIYIFYVGFREL